MRLLVGIILGVALTIGAAYVYDSRQTSEAANGVAGVSRTLVNWDVLNTELDHLGARARAEWNRLRTASNEN